MSLQARSEDCSKKQAETCCSCNPVHILNTVMRLCELKIYSSLILCVSAIGSLIHFTSYMPYRLPMLSPVHHQWQASPSHQTVRESEYSLGQTDEVGHISQLSPHTPSPAVMILVPYQQLNAKIKSATYSDSYCIQPAHMSASNYCIWPDSTYSTHLPLHWVLWPVTAWDPRAVCI
jgi:hypothetical protein